MTRKTINAIIVKHILCVLPALFGVSMLQAAEIAVSDFSAICGWSTNAVVCAVGDTVALPSGEYTINNPRVASISGTTVTALEPGFTGVIDASSNVGGIIVRPAVGGSGRVFVAGMDTATVLSNNQSITLNWSDENSWLCVDGGGGCPTAADDVAIIPVSINTTADNAKNNYAGYYLTFDGEITIGQLFFGSFKPGNLNIRLRPGTAGDATLAFARTDGEAPVLAVSGNAATAHNTWVRFVGNGDRNLSLDLSNGLLVDLGYPAGFAFRSRGKTPDLRQRKTGAQREQCGGFRRRV